MYVRSATHADLPAIDDIYHHYVSTSTCTFQLEPGTPAERRAWFDAHGPAHPILVACDGPGDPRDDRDAVIGWASLSPFQVRAGYRFTVENSIYVAQAHQRRGVGQMLLADVIRRARETGYHSIIATIAADQPASLNLHARAGFVPAGTIREVGWKFGRWLDVTSMQLFLSPSARPPA